MLWSPSLRLTSPIQISHRPIALRQLSLTTYRPYHRSISLPRNAFPSTKNSIAISHQLPFKSSTNQAFYRVAGLAASVGLGLTLFTSTIYCEPTPGKQGTVSNATPPPPGSAQSPGVPAPLPPPPQSNVNFIELSFGTVCGICAGVFVKKGAKMLAFAFGGVFVLLQYLGSQSLVRVDWSRMGQRFENLFYRKDAQGVSRPPNVGSLFRWLVDFLTADFQPRASFIAGFALGLRVG